jgi:hypothetical protein
MIKSTLLLKGLGFAGTPPHQWEISEVAPPFGFLVILFFGVQKLPKRSQVTSLVGT